MNKTVIFLSAAILPALAFADGFRVSYGESSAKLEPAVRMVAFNRHIKSLWDNENQQVSLELEAEYFIWENFFGDDITGGAITPMFRYQYQLNDYALYGSIGIGGAYADQIKWGNRDLGDNWMFSDTLEFGIQWKEAHRLSGSLKHYSNAGTNTDNDGVNIFLINYGYFW